MALFEYIAIAFSLVYSFAAIRLVGGLPHATRPGRIYWVYLLFVVTSLLFVINSFWGFWSYHDVTWSYPSYILALTSPTIQYFLTAILVPGDPAEIRSWRDHYFSVRRRFFIGVAVLGLAGMLTNTILVSMPLRHPARLGQIGTVAVGIAGLITPNPRFHAALAVASLLAVVAFGAIVLAQPASLD
jgi:hypothetical protein